MTEVLTTTEAADILGVNPFTVVRWLRAGKLDGGKVGHQWVITRESVMRRRGRRSPHRDTIQAILARKRAREAT